MIKKYWNNIVNGTEVRQSLSALRKEIQDIAGYSELQEMLEKGGEVLSAQLESEDAKTRKNAALLMGDLGSDRYLPFVYAAYENERQRFVRSAYLTAIGHFDYAPYVERLKAHLDTLQKEEITEENRKHISEEMHALTELIVRAEGIRKHTFTAWDAPYDVVLMCNRNYAGFIGEQLKAFVPDAKVKEIGAGLRARVGDLHWTGQLRTYQELLFMVKGMNTVKMEPEAVANMIAASGLMRFLEAGHDTGAPFYFRIECRSRQAMDEKSTFVKKLSAAIERRTNRALINSKDHYECELRIIENKAGACNVLVKLFTMNDDRFAYRGAVVPGSMKPAKAALCVALAGEYMKRDAQVLDPFCGVGTLLIERQKAVPAHSSYGVDILEEAIIKARENTEAAGQIVHYVNRDFFDFTHAYLFDEVLTDMPFALGKAGISDIHELYARFFAAIPRLLTKDATLILHSHNREYVKDLAPAHGFAIQQEFELSRRQGLYLYVLRFAPDADDRRSGQA